MSNKIVYLWVENYKEVHIDSQINFGSEFLFDLQKEKKKLTLSYSINESYIPDFFQTNNTDTGIVNVSAFIGENGSGKSLMCSLLRKIISGELRQTDFVLIYQIEEEGITKHLIYNETEYSFELSKEYSIDNKIINKAKPFVHKEMHYGGGWRSLKGVESIFYSPITDFSNDSIIYNKPNDIDVSNNNLIYEDIENEEYSRKELKPYHFHTIPRAANFKRQFQALHELGLSLPSGVKVHKDSIVVRLVELDVDFSNMDRSNFDNIPFQFIGLLLELDKIYHKERKTLLNSLSGHERYGKEYDSINQEIYFLEFIRGALKFFIYNLNKENSHLRHDQIQMQIDGLNYENAVNEFLTKQNFIESKILTILFDNIKSAKKEIVFFDYPNGNGEVLVRLPPTTTIALFVDNEDAMEYFREKGVSDSNNYVTRFLEFDLGVNLSSGEKAYIDLYSRLYYAKKLLNEKIEEKRIEEESIDLLVIIIDEGELGFHPQWQKEYLFNLLDIIPFIFTGIGKEVETKNKNKQFIELNFSNIQLILTSHSPFLLSDLPIRNVNFIERNKETGVSQIKYGEEVGMKETFGANIHELFSESFFIENGLIGKFAQTKIQNIINSINDETNRKGQDKIEGIKLLINTIGEPFLRNELTEMFYRKFQKQNRIDDLKNELKKLTEE